MTPPKEDAFIINIEPPPSQFHSAKIAEIAKHDVLHGRDAVMDHHSLGDTESTASSKTKAVITEEEQKQPSEIPLWLQTQVAKIRTSRTRQAILAFFFIVAAVLLAVLIWLETSGHFHEVFKKTVPLELSQGNYLGEIVPASARYPRSVQAFRGIPYAQSTAGDNRFRLPQPLNGTVDRSKAQRATSFGHVCPQGGGGKNQGEDCLVFNLYRPHYKNDSNTTAAEVSRFGKLPILIYVHGGGFNGGSGAERNMMSFVSWSETPIIGMSFNYRLGALGFLPSAAAQKAGLLNLGLKDQQAFFKWVQDNAADFGGDPKNVTIMGLSAGAHSVGHHLISYSPANKLTSSPPPFQKAIIESGGSLARATFVPTHPLHEQQFQEFLTAAGLNDTAEDKLFDELRALPLNKIANASNVVWKRWDASLRWPFQPVIDGPGGIIPDLPSQSWRKGNVLRIPILTGFNTNEGAVFVPTHANNASAMDNLMSSIIPALNKTDLSTLNTMYPDPTTTVGEKLYVYQPPSGFGTQFWRLDDSYAHYAYICPVLQAADMASNANESQPVYTYHYAARSNAHGGADHGDEAPVVTHDMDVIGNYPGVLAMADAMNGYWARFAATGDPNPKAGASSNVTTVTWAKFISPFENTTATAETAKTVALFGEGNDERMGARGRQNKGVAVQASNLTDRVRTECRFWFDRVTLSEGWGNGSTSIGTESAKA
ncbi:alpha/beta-hydrolase [Annulohypoxylon truncatum]|uniref:alpha/beta-hydrolase n=1 Tax=Annulohypoxylon truncatum TaxID=327061 RepID=UPI00200744E4|nr:alpha/beta-hydrolase [Annulohypoxylon truncatum]KAI1210400.1 alpha/beta-hydrolase [Annulohypoxylon truncatum]